MVIEIVTFDDISAAELSVEDQTMIDQGFMKTIYVPVHPFVEAVKQALAGETKKLIAAYQDPHLRRQDHMHERFFEDYIVWSRTAVDIRGEDFPHQYPTSGSNEAIRESISHYGNMERVAGRTPRIHVFEGEYEGYTAHANSHEVEVVVHSREDYQASLEDNFKNGERFYLSAPSGIDGNIWEGYEDFLTFLENYHPENQLMLDLAYLNTTFETPQIRTDSPVIEAIFISMSKSFMGTYYNRIGGVLSKSNIPGLWGNKWFKSIDAMLLGVNLMHNSELGEIPAAMRAKQLAAIENIRQDCGLILEPSDVGFVATQDLPEDPSEIQRLLARAGKVRYCLTPSINNLLRS